MAVLILENPGMRRGGLVPRRLLIGRQSMNHVVVEHRSVSRIHAWISYAGDRFYLRDANSRTGTRVGGRKLTDRYLLRDGDKITVGPATLTFLTTDELPEDVEPVDFAVEPTISPEERGILFDCTCGAPIWASLDYVGHRGQCSYCSHAIRVPHPDTVSKKPAAANGKSRSARTTDLKAKIPPLLSKAATPLPFPIDIETTSPTSTASAGAGTSLLPSRKTKPAVAAAEPVFHRVETCGVCQSSIAAFEERVTCPDCGLAFHSECWTENYGCSAYGCAQVNALKPSETADQIAAANGHDQPLAEAFADETPAPFPWEFLILAASVFGVLAGAVTFGVPSLLVGAAALVYFLRNRTRARTGVMLASVALGLVGIVAGILVSYVLYFK